MTNTIPDHVGREAVRLLGGLYDWPCDAHNPAVITVAKLLMNPPAPMTDPDEEAAKRVIASAPCGMTYPERLTRATEQMRREREAWDAGR